MVVWHQSKLLYSHTTLKFLRMLKCEVSHIKPTFSHRVNQWLAEFPTLYTFRTWGSTSRGCWDGNPEPWVGGRLKFFVWHNFDIEFFHLFEPNSTRNCTSSMSGDHPKLKNWVYDYPQVGIHACCYSCTPKPRWTALSSTQALGDLLSILIECTLLRHQLHVNWSVHAKVVLWVEGVD